MAPSIRPHRARSQSNTLNMTTASSSSSSSKASKRRTRRKKQKLSVGSPPSTTGSTSTIDTAAVDSNTHAPGRRQRAPTKIIPGKAIVTLSNAEAISEVQQPTTTTRADAEPPGHAKRSDNTSNRTNRRRSHPSTPMPTETIQIGSSDGTHYIHYEKQKLPPEKEKQRKAAKRRPQYDAFLCKRGSDERELLPRHPQTGDPICERKISNLVSKTARCPDGAKMHRIDVLDRDDENNGHIASVCWVHGNEIDKAVRHRLGLGSNEWKDGKALKILRSVYTKARDSEHLTKASKSTASGCYAEVGHGCGAGRQNSSFNAAPPGSSKRDGIAFPYMRNPELSSEVEESLSLSLSCVTILMEKYWPDLNMNLTPTSLASSNGLCFPRPPTQGVLKGQPTMNAHQIALRLCGWCQPDGACGAITDPTDLDVEFPSGTRQEKESLKRLKKSRFGGSGLHVDWLDPDSRMGALTLYVSFIEESRHSSASARSGGLEDCDLLVLAKKKESKGRAICIETMKEDFICLVFHHASRHVHGSVFPNNGMPQAIVPQLSGMKIVCYHTSHKLVRASGDEKVLERYVRAHAIFLEELLRRRWYRVALCHAVPLLRIVASALAHDKTTGNSTRSRSGVYGKILHKVWRGILPYVSQRRFRWAHSMLGLKLICYYRRDSGRVVMIRHKTR